MNNWQWNAQHNFSRAGASRIRSYEKVIKRLDEQNLIDFAGPMDFEENMRLRNLIPLSTIIFPWMQYVNFFFCKTTASIAFLWIKNTHFLTCLYYSSNGENISVQATDVVFSYGIHRVYNWYTGAVFSWFKKTYRSTFLILFGFCSASRTIGVVTRVIYMRSFGGRTLRTCTGRRFEENERTTFQKEHTELVDYGARFAPTTIWPAAWNRQAVKRK